MTKFKNIEVGKIALIQLQENDRVVQIGLTQEQSIMLQFYLATISKENKLIQMPEEYDLILKSQVCKKCKAL